MSFKAKLRTQTPRNRNFRGFLSPSGPKKQTRSMLKPNPRPRGEKNEIDLSSVMGNGSLRSWTKTYGFSKKHIPKKERLKKKEMEITLPSKFPTLKGWSKKSERDEALRRPRWHLNIEKTKWRKFVAGSVAKDCMGHRMWHASIMASRSVMALSEMKAKHVNVCGFLHSLRSILGLS